MKSIKVTTLNSQLDFYEIFYKNYNFTNCNLIFDDLSHIESQNKKELSFTPEQIIHSYKLFKTSDIFKSPEFKEYILSLYTQKNLTDDCNNELIILSHTITLDVINTLHASFIIKFLTDYAKCSPYFQNECLVLNIDESGILTYVGGL